MVSAAMAVQDHCGGSRSNTVVPCGNGISLNASLHTATGSHLKDHLSCGNDYYPKVRKPYTITKQRERWTEEEHKKFLEALKLYGRAWRRIEEYVGTKTAVQIRSHAQKFFSKVVRESSGSNTSLVEPIEIPPPRPKRKPVHPYPRKIHLPNAEPSIPEQPLRSSSPNMSVSEQENQSPTSVLSVVGSDALNSNDSNISNHSLSPISSARGVHPHDFTISEPNSSPEVTRSLTPVQVTADAIPDEQLTKEQVSNFFPTENAVSDELVEETSTRSFKLFGRTLLVTECHRASSPTIGASKLQQSDVNEGKTLQPLPWNFMASEMQSGNKDCTWNYFPNGPTGAIYYMQLPGGNSNPVETIPHQLWALYGGMPFPFTPFHEQEHSRMDYSSEEVQDKEIQKEGSWTGSNSGAVNEGEIVDRNMDGETQSRLLPCDEKEVIPAFDLKSNEKLTTSSDLKVNPEMCMRGFVPYRRRVAERESQSSSITGEAKEEQRIRLCL